MKRTQIYIEEEIFSVLEKESAMSHRTISEIIRDSIRETYHHDSLSVVKKLNNVFGIWKSRKFDTDRYIRDLRRDRMP